MATFNFPDVTPSDNGFVLVPDTDVTYNKYSKVERVFDGGADHWRCELVFNILLRADAVAVMNLLKQLRGSANLVKIVDHNYLSVGSWGNGVVDGSDNEGAELTMRGFPASTEIAPVGERFELNNRLHELTEPAITDELGNVTLVFLPQLLTIPTDGQSLETENPKAVFFWENPKMPRFVGDRRTIKNITLTFRESLRQ